MTGLPTLKVEVEFTAGVWTDLTSSINLARSEIVTSRGRSSQSDDGQPGTFSCVFENTTGALTPDNPAGTYFPNVVPGKRIRYTVGAVVRFYGRIMSWDPSFTDSTASGSVVTVSARDTLGDLATARLRSGLWHESKALAPTLLYGLDETNGNLGAFEDSGGQTLTIRDADTGGGCDFAATTAGLEDGGTVSFTPGDSGGYRFLAAARSDSRTLDSVSLRVKPAGAMMPFLAYQEYQVGGSTFIRYLVVNVASAGAATVSMYDSYYSTNAAVTTATALPQDRWTHLVVTYSGTTVTLYVDGVSAGTTSFSYGPVVGLLHVGGTNLPLDGTPAPGRASAGQVADVAVWSGTVLTAPEVAALSNAGSSSATESVGARVARVCGYLGLTPGGSVQGKALGAQPFSGRSALEVLQEAVRGDSRLLYDQSGLVVYRQDDHPTAPSVTYDAEGDLEGAPTLTRSGQGRAATQRAESPAGGSAAAEDSGAPEATEGSAIVTALADAGDVAAIAQRAVAEARDARLRLTKLTVDLVTAENAVTADTQTLVLGDLVRVDGLPSAVLGWTYMDGYLLGSTERASISSYVVEMDLEPVDAPVDGRFELDVGGRFGTDGTTTVGALTSSGTTVVITSAGTPFTTAAGSYPLDVDINGERVTLNSAPASSTSPQTFTGVTRGVAPSVARAHSAGESVDVWRAARFTI